MATVNKVIILGNLGKDPEIRHLENGRMRVQLLVATHEHYKNKEGEKVNHTDWHEIILWSPHAEIAAQHLNKGNQVYIEGRLNHRTYVDKEGQQHYTIQIMGQQLILLNKSRATTLPLPTRQSPPSAKLWKNDMGTLPL